MSTTSPPLLLVSVTGVKPPGLVVASTLEPLIVEV
jgi:hypothetical protein